MKELQRPCENQVLLCSNERPPGAQKPSCGFHGAAELRAWLKQELKREGLWGAKVRVVETGCLDVCAKDLVTVDMGGKLLLLDATAEREELLARIRAL